MEAQTYIGRLIEVANRKYQALEAMLQTYLEQNEALNAGNPETQESLIATRQAQMDAVDRLDEEFHVYTERLKATLGIQSLDELSRFHLDGKAELKDVVVRIRRMLEELSERHQQTQTHLGEAYRVSGEKNMLIGKTKLASRAYQPGQHQPAPSVFFDKKK